MSDQKSLLSLKKTFFYNLFPSKVEDEACKLNNNPYVVTRELIEIRDIYPPQKSIWKTPGRSRKRLPVTSLENGCDVHVDVWDVTGENIPKKYEGGSVFLRKLHNDDFYLSCIKLFNSHGLSVGDEIGLYWDPRSSSLMFKLLS
ncbi:hypothetical protein H5410_028703 [Solanum commersonii]|uniref:Uncharacterized protein n=1 Tax=Solanum commersonii TaxID=4109 RepID=A0A9J5Z2N8_SOLCO|nr:hypothetical protein H5410_028703 [Solanum commersonii]